MVFDSDWLSVLQARPPRTDVGWLSNKSKNVRNLSHFETTAKKMVLKAVCVLKGAGETTGVVHFEQEVRHTALLLQGEISIQTKQHGGLTCILMVALALRC